MFNVINYVINFYNSLFLLLQGDSGGPLIINDEVVGVVSMSYGCGVGWPDIYTRVQSYNSWIKKQLV